MHNSHSSCLDKEKRIVEIMIRIYCRRCEGNEQLCDSCKELLMYACERLDRCPHGENKGSCKQCTTHCYRPAMRERMRTIMRFSGPRMIIYAPLEFIKHYLLKY